MKLGLQFGNNPTRKRTNLMTASPSSIGSWVDNGDGTFTIDGSQGATQTLFYPSAMTVGRQYRCDIDVVSVGAGTFRAFSSPNAVNMTAAGSYGSILTAGSANFNWQALVGFSGTVRPVGIFLLS